MKLAAVASRVRAWAPRILFTSATQAAVQICGFLAGLAVIRLLPPDQYAYYTLTLATFGMLTVLSDGGMNSALMAFGGPCWKDPKALGEAFHETARYRRLLAFPALTVCLPLLLYLLMGHQMGALGALVLCAITVPLFLWTVTGQMREVVLKLHQQLLVIQTIQASGAVVRILGLMIALTIMPMAWMAFLVAAVIQLVSTVVLKRYVTPLVRQPNAVSLEMRTSYRTYIKRSLPGTLYYAFSAQISILIISVLGNTQDIAEVGVAGRLGAACSILSSIIGLIFIPRFARTRLAARHQLIAVFCLTTGILVAGAAVCALLWLFPGALSLLVGASYTEIDEIATWSILSSIVGMAGATVFHMSAARGYIMRPSLYIGTGVVSFAASYLLIGAETSLQVFQMNAAWATGVLLAALAFITYELSRLHPIETAD